MVRNTSKAKEVLPASSAGRPSNREKILDAAEIEFATNSYESCSMRMIADASGVNLGLLHYYFGSKQALFTAVFMRRAAPLAERRKVLLKEARQRVRGAPVPLEDLILCFVTPIVEMMQQGEGPRAFVRLHSRLRAESMDFARDLRRAAFNEVKIAFVEAFHESCPHLSRESVVWRLISMVGAYLFLISQDGHVEDLSDGKCDPEDLDTAIRQVVVVAAAGFRAPEIVRPGAADRDRGRIRMTAG